MKEICKGLILSMMSTITYLLWNRSQSINVVIFEVVSASRCWLRCCHTSVVSREILLNLMSIHIDTDPDTAPRASGPTVSAAVAALHY